MSTNNDGGPAFPNTTGIRHVSEHEHAMDGSHGMTLRDYFAARAIPACIDTQPVSFYNRLRAFLGLNYFGPKPVPQKVAIQAYAIADAMLAERAK